MNATIIDMELIKADSLTVDALEIGDLIGYNDEVVEILFIESDSTGDNYDIEIVNDFGEKEVIQFAFNDEVDWYVYLDQKFCVLPRTKPGAPFGCVAFTQDLIFFPKSAKIIT